MCGIVGTLSLEDKPINTNCIKKMCDVISHRGPDDAGYFVAQNRTPRRGNATYYQNFTDSQFAHISPYLPRINSEDGKRRLRKEKWTLFLGHRRLSVIDLSPAGHQPMSDKSKQIWLVYNGEIYNFKSLRAQLKKRGYEFKSRSDTEVIIYAYKEWGIDCIKKFNGMFAFALWDNRKQVLYLARDRYGIKPLYYWQNGEVFLFSSEIKAFLQYPEFEVELDLGTLLEYFTFQNTFTHKTLFKGVKILPPGHFMQIFPNGEAKICEKQYWDFHFEEERNVKSEKEYQEELDRLFNRAVKRQLVSDVEVGSYLSGGIDTGSIVAVTSQYQKDLKTFCVGFDLTSASGLELSFDEREKAEYLSYLYQTEHYEMVLKSGDMQKCLPKVVWALEDLRMGQSYPNLYASKLASKFVKVCLTGTGGDELFAGYPWRYYRTIRSKNFDEYIEGYYKYWQRLIRNKILKKLFYPVWDEVKQVWTEDIFRSVFGNDAHTPSRPEDYINYSLYFEAKTFLHGLLTVEDKLNMAHSLEIRVPFLDNDLVNFAMKIPVRLKLKDIDKFMRLDENDLAKREKYFQKMRDGKIILRKVLKKYIPEKVTNQKKQGFSGPDASWFKGESINYVKNLLLDKKAGIYDYFDYKTIENLLFEHMEGKNNRRLFIWSLLCFEWWLKLFMGK